jgi:transposase-like protein
MEIAKPVVQRQQNGTLQCPHCLSRQTVRWGTAGGVPRSRCRACGHTFNALTKTPLARLRYKKRWLTYVGTMVERRSIRESAAACGVSPATSLRWHRRFLNCSSSERVRLLSALMSAYASAPLAGLPESGGLAELSWCRELLPLILSWIL